MKATRAYIASLGTTGVLLAASILLLTVVSTLVAFDGWPSGTVTARVDRVTVGAPALQIPVSATAGAPAATGAAGSASGGPGGAPGGGPVPGAGGVADRRAAGAPVVPQLPGGAVGVLPGGGLPNPLGGSTPDIPVLPVPGGGSLKEQVATGAEQTTGSLGGAAGEVSPQAGQVVSSAGSAAARAVRGVPVTG